MPRHVMFAGMRAALEHGQYQPYFDELLKDHPEDNYFFYFDISFEETLKRHASIYAVL